MQPFSAVGWISSVSPAMARPASSVSGTTITLGKAAVNSGASTTIAGRFLFGSLGSASRQSAMTMSHGRRRRSQTLVVGVPQSAKNARTSGSRAA